MALSPRLLRPIASGFDPRRIAGLAIWLDASVDSSLTFNGNTVSEWRDLSGNARHFSQGTAASQPDGVSRTQNGKRVLDFGGSQALVGGAAALSVTRNVGGLAMIAVYRLDITSPLFQGVLHFSRNGNSGNSRATMQAWTSQSLGYVVGGRRTDADSFQTVSSGIAALTTNLVVMTGILDYANSNAFVYLDGQLKGSNLSFQTNGLTPDNDGDVATIGSVDGINFINGAIGEIIVYRNALASAEREAVERYLGAKWGVTVA